VDINYQVVCVVTETQLNVSHKVVLVFKLTEDIYVYRLIPPEYLSL